ncbi:MAG TPA: hypothetical protein VLM85_10825 [Polyangiaceae bacterium]|nr:hypothetical protein [Polyangiaceae bacterium]
MTKTIMDMQMMARGSLGVFVVIAATTAACSGKILDLGGDGGTSGSGITPSTPCNTCGGGANPAFTTCNSGFLCAGDKLPIANCNNAPYRVSCDCTSGECTCSHNGVTYASVSIGACRCASDYPLAVPAAAARACGLQ